MSRITAELLQRIIEAALMAAHTPLNIQQLQALFDDEERPNKIALEAALAGIKEQSQQRGFELMEVASGWRFQVCQELSPWIGRLWEERPQKYSRALLETLALVAYRQPITRGDIEQIRGVAVSSSIMRTLLDRGWVKVVGHRDVPGRPAMYATTREFLDYFNLQSLEELPTLAEIRDLDSLNQELGLEVEDSGAAAQAIADAKNRQLQVDVPEPIIEQQGDLLDETSADESLSLDTSAQNGDPHVDAGRDGRDEDTDDFEGEGTEVKHVLEAPSEAPLEHVDLNADILSEVAAMEVDDAFADEFTSVDGDSVNIDTLGRELPNKEAFDASLSEYDRVTDEEQSGESGFNDDALVHFTDEIDPAFLDDENS